MSLFLRPSMLPSLFVSFLSVLLLFSPITGFNVTQILSQYPDFAIFSEFLQQNRVADMINARQTITVLAVGNSAMSPLYGQPAQAMKMALSLQVILDYFDVKKLENLQNRTAILTTLFQTSGLARGLEGFLNVTLLGKGSVALGSAEGSHLRASLVKSLYSQPYDISVLHISSLLVPPEILYPPENGQRKSSSPPPHSVPAPSPNKAAPPRSWKAPWPSMPPKSAKAPRPSMPPKSVKAPRPSMAPHSGKAPRPSMAPHSGKAPSPSKAAEPPHSRGAPSPDMAAPPKAGKPPSSGGVPPIPGGVPSPSILSPPAPPTSSNEAPEGGTKEGEVPAPPAIADAPESQGESSATLSATGNGFGVVLVCVVSLLSFA